MDGGVGVVMPKQFCMYGETEKISKYSVGEGICRHTLGRGGKSSWL